MADEWARARPRLGEGLMALMPKGVALRLWIGLAGSIIAALTVFVLVTVTNLPVVGIVYSPLFWWVVLVLGLCHVGSALWVVATWAVAVRRGERDWCVAAVVYTTVEAAWLTWFLAWLRHPFFG